MNMYDFDGTIYDGDSGADFLKYSLRRKPFLVLKSFIKTFFKYLKYKRGKIEFKEVKETLFSFVKQINNLDKFIKVFVNKHKKNIKDFYFKQKRKDDFIITASLDFYVKPLCRSVGIKRVVATKYDVSRGKIIGNNCKSKEKAIIVDKMFNKKFANFYTDSKNDEPLFKYADNTYIVKKNELVKYNQNYKFKNSIFNFDFIIFVFCGALGTLTNFFCSSLISRKINPISAYVVGYLISLFVSYILNMIYVFKRKLNLKDFIKFVISYVPNFIILFLFVYIFINKVALNKYLVYLLAAIIGLPITFMILKIKTFKDKK